MTPTAIGISLFVVMLALMALRVPIAIAMFVPGAIGYTMLASELALLSHLKGALYARFSVYDLSVIPLFLLMGQFATKGGLSAALFRAAVSFVGHFRGGLAMAAVLACAAFGAICGSSVATAATVAQVALPEMKRFNYSGRLATATLAAGGTLGILIPPSVVLVIYAILAQQNIAKLFAAAMIPGLIAAVGYLIAIGIYARLHPDAGPAQSKHSWHERWTTLLEVWPIAAIFVIVFGGIYGGIFTPTEGAGVGAVATFIAGIAHRELGLREIRASLLGAAETSAMIFMIFLGADMLNSALALSQLPAQLATFVGGLDVPPLVIVFGVLVLYVVLGCVMDELSMILLTIPVIFPAIMGLDLFGLNPSEKAIWFGIVVLMVVEIGLIMPPVGLNVYVVNGLARDVPMAETYRGVFPFLISDAFRTLLLLFFPIVSLWAVRLLD